MAHRAPVSRYYGKTRVTVLIDGFWQGKAEAIIHQGGEDRRRKALESISEQDLLAPVNCFLLSNDDGLSLIDAGAGTDWGENFGKMRNVLSELGVKPADISTILLTHIHLDHACGLFDGEDRYFPDAKIMVPAADLSFFTDSRAREATPPAKRGGFDVTERLLRLYGPWVQTMEPGQVLPEIELVPMPGHTPGHAGFVLGQGDEKLVIVGDVFHFAEVQAADPDIGVPYDISPRQAAEARKHVLAQAYEEHWHICGGHLHGFQRITRDGETFRLKPLSPATL